MMLQTSGTATFLSDGSGSTIATVSLGPQRYGENWSVRSASISTTSTVKIAACRMYRNMVQPSSFIDGTSSANQNVTSIGVELQSLDKVIFVFMGGDMGSFATVSLNGTVTYG